MIHSSSYVLTSKGLRRAGDIRDAEVVTFDEKGVSLTLITEPRPLYREGNLLTLVTSDGHELLCSGLIKIKTPFGFIAGTDLAAGDRVSLQPREGNFGEASLLHNDCETGLILGLLARGTVSAKDTLALFGTSSFIDPEEARAAVASLTALSGPVELFEKNIDQIGGSKLFYWLADYVSHPELILDQVIEPVMSGSIEATLCYLAALFADPDLKAERLGEQISVYSLKTHTFARQVQLLLLNHGILSSVHGKVVYMDMKSFSSLIGKIARYGRTFSYSDKLWAMLDPFFNQQRAFFSTVRSVKTSQMSSAPDSSGIYAISSQPYIANGLIVQE